MGTYISAIISSDVDTYVSAIISPDVDTYKSTNRSAIEYT